MPSCGPQVGAFKDYTPGAAPAAAAEPDEKEEQAPAKEEEAPAEPEDGGGGGGGGGDYPPHSVMGLPALSPTMSQGALPACLGAQISVGPLEARQCVRVKSNGTAPCGGPPEVAANDHCVFLMLPDAVIYIFTMEQRVFCLHACVLACLSASPDVKTPAL